MRWRERAFGDGAVAREQGRGVGVAARVGEQIVDEADGLAVARGFLRHGCKEAVRAARADGAGQRLVVALRRGLRGGRAA